MSGAHPIGGKRWGTNPNPPGPKPHLRPDGAPIDAVPDDGEFYHPAHVERNADGMPVRYEHKIWMDNIRAAEIEAAYQRGIHHGIGYACLAVIVLVILGAATWQGAGEFWRVLP